MTCTGKLLCIVATDSQVKELVTLTNGRLSCVVKLSTLSIDINVILSLLKSF